MEFSEYNPADNDNEGTRARRSRDAYPVVRSMRPGSGSDGNTTLPPSLFEYWRLLLRRKGTMVIATVLGTSLGLLVSVPRTPIFQARATLEIQGLNDNLLNTRDVNPTASSAGSTAYEEIQTQVKILQGDALVNRVVKKLGVTGPLPARTRVARLRASMGLAKVDEVSARGAAVMMAAQTLGVEALQPAHIIQIAADSPDPKVAAEFVNTLAEEYIQQKLESRETNSQRTSEWLNKQVVELKSNIETSEEKLQDYALSAGLMFTSEKESSIAEQRLHQLQAELSVAQADRVAKQSKYEVATTAPAESLPQVLDDGTLRELQSRITGLRSQMAELNTSLTPEHYRVQRLQAQINELQPSFEAARGNIIKRIANEYEDAKRREDLLGKEYANQANVVSEQAGKVAHYGILKRDVDTNRELYEGMLQRVKEYAIASAVTANNVGVIDPAKAPGAPYKPDVYMYTMLGMVTGVFLGILFIIRDERVDRRIHAPGQAPTYLDVPELGVILSADADATLAVQGPSKHMRSLHSVIELSRRIARDFSANHPNNVPEPEGEKTPSADVELITWQKQSSLFAECFRTTAASILFSQQDGVPPQVLVVTSANPEDGKSTTASNLAVALAETKRRVLLIDADLRRPYLHRIFNLENRWGLINVLQGDIEIDDYPKELLVRDTAIPNLFVMNSGTDNSSVIHLLHSKRLPQLLRRLRKEFDVILIDAPPVLQIADARVLARLSDGVVFVIRSANTTRDMALAACRRFREDRTQVLGTVLNRWDPRDFDQQQYYYQTYYKYYAHKETKA